MKRPFIRGLFVLTAVALVVQFVVIRKIGEPWPAVVMPGFEDAPKRNREAVSVIPRITLYTADSSRHRIDEARLLAPLPKALRFSAMKRMFRPHSSRTPEKYKKAFWNRVADPELHRWMRRRLQAMGHQDPVRLEFAWEVVYYRLDDTSKPPVPLDTLTIDLAPQRDARVGLRHE